MTMASSSFDRETSVAIAKLADQAEGYDDMVEEMTKVAKEVAELTPQERNLLSLGFKNAVERRISSCKKLSSNESDYNRTTIEYRDKVEGEIARICRHILSLLDKYLIPSCKPGDHITRVFYLKMKADYFRYLFESVNVDDYFSRKEATDESSKAYEAATILATAKLLPAHPIRLGLALNYSVFYYKILASRERAYEIAKEAMDKAYSGLGSLKNEEDFY